MKDYMNDPRLLNDPGLKDAMAPVKEVYAARLKVQDDIAGMTSAQRTAYFHKGIDTSQLVNRSGMGRLQPRA